MLRRFWRALRWPFERVAGRRGWRKLVWVTAECLLAVVCGAALYRWTCLWGLPDVGTPATLADLRPPKVAPELDAFVLYDRASRSLARGPGSEDGRVHPPRVGSGNQGVFDWAAAKPEAFARFLQGGEGSDAAGVAPKLDGWVEPRREALDLFVEGAERPQASSSLDPLAKSWSDKRALSMVFLADLALSESLRLQRAGDLDGAWRDTLAALRAAAHLAARGDFDDRFTASRIRQLARRRVPAWADDPRNTADRVKRALADLRALGLKAPDDSYAITSFYLFAAEDYARPTGVAHVVRIRPILINGEYQIPLEWTREASNFRRWLEREPERGRRVMNLLTAHWLAALKTPPGNPPLPALSVVYQPSPAAATNRLDFFDLSSDAPAAAVAVPPGSMAAWFAASSDARRAIGNAWNALTLTRQAERADARALVLPLAVAAYRFAHPAEAKLDNDLEGTVMKSLPDLFGQDETDTSADLLDLGVIE